jgi:hypothetical protein
MLLSDSARAREGGKMEGGGLGFEKGWARACAPERSNVRSIERWGSNEASAVVAPDVLVMPFSEINGGRNEGVREDDRKKNTLCKNPRGGSSCVATRLLTGEIQLSERSKQSDWPCKFEQHVWPYTLIA